MSDTAIRVRGLTKRFGDFTAVDDLAFHVERGSIFAFLGANGSGKSTSIRMMIGLLAPTAGEIEVDGVDVIRQPRRVREHIGYMGQKVSLYTGLSLRENVEFYAGLHGLAGGELESRWAELRERFELGPSEHERPENLPAGIRQRAGLALATLHRPRILFLDEPTAGVDVHSRSVFWEAIQDEADLGTTVFVTTHFLEEVELCDRVCFIDAGRLVADDAPETLRRRFGGGSVVRIRIPAARADARSALEARLVAHGLDVAGDAEGLRIRAPQVEGALLELVSASVSELPDASVELEVPAMPEVFRRLLGGLAREAV